MTQVGGGISHTIASARGVSDYLCEVMIQDNKGVGTDEGSGHILPQYVSMVHQVVIGKFVTYHIDGI